MYDVIIAGAGASGLFAAVLLSRSGKKVLVLEHNTRPGKKLALCGGGNCNLGPIERESAELSLRYTKFTPHPKTGFFRQESVRALKTLYYTYPPSLVHTLFTSKELVIPPFTGLGLKLREEEEGRLYPAEYDARSFADELWTRAEKAGAQFNFNCEVQSIIKNESGGYTVQFLENSESSVEDSRCVILATGGFAYPKIGGSDTGNTLLSNLGIAYRSGKPAMGPLLIQDYPFSASSGTVIQAQGTVVSRKTGAELVRSKKDQLLFTHRGLSGPLILDLCASVHECETEEPFLVLDLLPDLTKDTLLASMQLQVKEHPQKMAVQILSVFFPKVLSATILKKAHIDSEMISAEIPKAAMMRCADLVKAFSLEVKLPTSIHEAMSWSGGCESSEIDFATMESKKNSGLFLTGDMVSMCRPCGGYSLWFCWTSALAACIAINKQ